MTNYKNILIDEVIKFLNIPTPTGETEAGLDFIENFCERFELEIFKNLNGNILVKKKNSETSGLVLCGHYDTVSGFIKPEIKNDILYGRGACDMKSSIISMLLATAFSKKKSPVVALTCDEEVDSDGAIMLAPFLKDNKWCIIGEPTDLNLCPGHKGRAVYEVELFGRSCHASYMPDDNIFYSLERLINALKIITKLDLKKEDTLTIVNIEVDEVSMNKVPDKIRIIIDRRINPPMNDYTQDLEFLKNKLKGYGISNFDIGLYKKKKNHTLPYLCGDQDLLNFAQKIISNSGLLFESKLFTATCDAFFFSKSLPVVIIGPGSLSHAHTVDEKVKIDDIINSYNIFSSAADEI